MKVLLLVIAFAAVSPVWNTDGGKWGIVACNVRTGLETLKRLYLNLGPRGEEICTSDPLCALGKSSACVS